MTADQFRLILALCAIVAVLGYLASVDGSLTVIVIILALIAVVLWLCWRVIKWAWRNWG